MAKKSKRKKFEADEGNFGPDGGTQVSIPDEAIYYIVSNYLQGKSATGLSVVTGVSTQTVEDILQLLVDWSAKNGHVKDGVINIGVSE